MSDQSRLAFTIFLIFAVVLGSYLLVSPIKSASNNIEKSKYKIMVDGWSNEKLKALKGRFYIDDDSDTINRDGRTNLVESLEEENPDGHCNLVEPSKIDNVLNNINIFERFTFVLILL
jgi:hypothetical protein